MLETVFEFLFKYRPVVFEQAELQFALTPATSLVAALAGLGAAAAVLTYSGVRVRGGARDRAVLALLRLAAVAVVLLCLAGPKLIVRAAVPQQNFLGILLDDSRSMRIADVDGEPRSAYIEAEFADPAGPLARALSDRFVLRTFRFARTPERLDEPAALSFSGTQTRLADALDRAREELTGLPLAGLVVVTDGADTGDRSVDDALLALKGAAVPVFTVGVGSPTQVRDVQIGRISVPPAVLKGSSLLVDVVVTHNGYARTEVPVNVEHRGRILASETVTLPGAGEPATIRLRFTAADAGPQVLTFRVPPQPGELVTENNAREVPIEVEDRREKILYFEGEPRWEVKFLRRAVADDENLQLVVLQRTAENKYLRLEVDQPEELVSGFPKTREELFGYRAVILGSIEASAFTGDQLRMLADFVDRRGGGLLMLGGRRAFAEGGYARTPVADILPVVLDEPVEGELLRLHVRPTRAGSSHGALQIVPDSEEASAERWGELPEVTSVNPIHRVKPGATVLLTGDSGAGREQVVLAYHRYGRGQVLAFTPQDSWLWQLHADVPVDDLTHENLWRQLLRWLRDGVPDPLELRATPEQVEAGERVALEAEVVDGTFLEVNDAQLVATVTSPAGRTTEVPMEWTGERNGQYRGGFTPDEDGLYEISLTGSRGGTYLGSADGFVRVAPSNREFFDATMRESLLRRVADETDGRFYTPANAAALAEDIQYTGRGITTVEERDLWDMPIVLFVLFGLILGEWSYRRARGLV